MKKKIVFIVEATLGGIRQHVCDIIENLNQDEYETWLIYSDLRADQGFCDELPKLGQVTHMILCNEMQRSIRKGDYYAYKRICKLLTEIKPDIVHCHSSKAGIVGRLAAKHCKVKQVLYTPNAYAFQSLQISNIKRKLYIWAERFLSRYATTKTINVSKGEMKLAIDYKLDKEDKFTLIYNGIPEVQLESKEDIRKKLGFAADRYLVGVTARCAEQKDPMAWLKIADQIITKRCDVDFVYIGDGPLLPDMQKWVKEKKLENRIKLLGFRLDASQIVGMFDIYLSTALYEGLPYSMIEAMRAGVPIVATDVVGNNEIVESGENGYLFALNRIDIVMEYIMKLMDQTGNANIKSKEFFLIKFSLAKMMKDLEVVYCEQ